MTFPAVPTAVNVLIVWILNAVNFCVLPASIFRSLKVLFHCIVKIAVPVVAFQILLYV